MSRSIVTVTASSTPSMFTSVTGNSYPPVYHDKKWRGASEDLCISSLSVVWEITEWEESLFTEQPKSAVGKKTGGLVQPHHLTGGLDVKKNKK